MRDAAVTTWIHVATSPIYGQVTDALPKPGDRIGSEGVIARVFNPKADRSALDHALATASEAEAVDEAAEAYLEELYHTVADRRSLPEQHRSIYSKRLDAEIDGMTKRKESLAAQSDLDEAQSCLLESERLVADLAAQLGALSASRDALADGAALTNRGDGQSWGPVGLLDLEASLAEARLTNAWAEVAREEETYETLREGRVKAPNDAILWSMIVGEGAAVGIGTPVASWIDGSVLLVDVPLADAEVALLAVGSRASVILEGESQTRAARVLLTRGSAATIGRDDLAAIAKGRSDDIAQVLLSLETEGSAFQSCPVGRAAYVDFPGVGFLDVLAARLRF